MKRFGFLTAGVIVRIAVSLLVLGIAVGASVLSFSTPLQKVAGRPDAAQVVVLGTLAEQSEGDPVACLRAVRGDSTTYVIGQRSWPSHAFVLVSGLKRTTSTGRAVVIEQLSWSVPFHWVHLPELSGVISRLPFLIRSSQWFAAGLILILIVILARFMMKTIALGSVAFVGFIAGSSLAHAAVAFNLIDNSLLACASVAAGVTALTLSAARLSQ